MHEELFTLESSCLKEKLKDKCLGSRNKGLKKVSSDAPFIISSHDLDGKICLKHPITFSSLSSTTVSQSSLKSNSTKSSVCPGYYVANVEPKNQFSAMNVLNCSKSGKSLAKRSDKSSIATQSVYPSGEASSSCTRRNKDDRSKRNSKGRVSVCNSVAREEVPSSKGLNGKTNFSVDQKCSNQSNFTLENPNILNTSIKLSSMLDYCEPISAIIRESDQHTDSRYTQIGISKKGSVQVDCKIGTSNNFAIPLWMRSPEPEDVPLPCGFGDYKSRVRGRRGGFQKKRILKAAAC